MYEPPAVERPQTDEEIIAELNGPAISKPKMRWRLVKWLVLLAMIIVALTVMKIVGYIE